MEAIHKDRFRLDTSLGYMYVYMPNHELANSAGKVYEHIYVANTKLRRVKHGEVVHHVDRDKTNNNKDNLLILSIKAHAHLHASSLHSRKLTVKKTCPVCSGYFMVHSDTGVKENIQVTCSHKCSHLHRRKFNPTKDELEELVWQLPSTKVAKIFNVSDKAVEQRCKVLGIEKPPRGYWMKKKFGKI